ncbi:MAG: phosphoribosyltransferase family protein [Pseudomonadota bacterium]
MIAATYYNDVSRKLILAYKHGGRITLSKLLGQIMSSRMPKGDPGNPPLLIPVPLHRTRLWQRGFNQAALLANELAKREHGLLLVDGLKRIKRTPSLGGLGREERHRVLTGAITVPKTRVERIRKRNVFLVDDVLTSGSTSAACVAALHKAGANSVRIACFARVDKGHTFHED